MARISKYNVDISINDSDTLLSTDGDDSNKTKVITLLDLKRYIIPEGGQAGQVLKSDGQGGVYWG